jgi:hypothetical protein
MSVLGEAIRCVAINKLAATGCLVWLRAALLLPTHVECFCDAVHHTIAK